MNKREVLTQFMECRSTLVSDIFLRRFWYLVAEAVVTIMNLAAIEAFTIGLERDMRRVMSSTNRIYECKCYFTLNGVSRNAHRRLVCIGSGDEPIRSILLIKSQLQPNLKWILFHWALSLQDQIWLDKPCLDERFAKGQIYILSLHHHHKRLVVWSQRYPT